MDARLDPAKFLGFEEGDAHVIRNAGGLVTDDALRSLILSHWLLGTQEAVVVAHEDCGMLTFSNAELQQRLAEKTGHDASHIDFQPFADLDESVRTSVRRIRDCPFLPDSFAATGFVYDVRSGQQFARRLARPALRAGGGLEWRNRLFGVTPTAGV